MNLFRAAGATCLLASALLTASTAAAQSATPPDTSSTHVPFADTTGWLPANHWTRHALARLAAQGRIPTGYAALAWPARRATVRRLLRRATTPPPTRSPIPTPTRTAIAWLERFDREFDALDSFLPHVIATPPALGVETSDGRLMAGNTIPSATGFDYTGPQPVNRRAYVFVQIAAGIQFGRGFGFSGEGRLAPDMEENLHRFTATARFGPVHAWFGRREVGFGPDPAGLTLSGRVPVTGAGLDTPDGFLLPGFLEALGPFRVNQVVARFSRSGSIRRPWFVATRVSFAPSDRIAFGINRAALFGGEGNEEVTVGRVLLVLFGITDSRGKDSDFENQVASLDVAWNAGRSVLVWAEYGFDDAGTSFILVPGLTLGALWAGPSWAPALSIGGSVTGIASSCCGHPAWYLHGALSDGWTDEGELLGHPLGGNGLEAGLDLALDPVGAPLLARTRLFVRDRGSENLFSPDRYGVTSGVETSFQIWLGGVRWEARLETEWGAGPDGWRAEFRAGF